LNPKSPLWPAQLDHIRIDSDDPPALAAFYRDILGMAAWQTTDGSFVLTGPQRRVVVGKGEPGAQPYSAFRVQSPRQLAELRAYLEAKGVALLASPSPLFDATAFAVRDPDSRLALFGLPRADMPAGDHSGFKPVAAALPARLQHVVVASTRLQEMDFYSTRLLRRLHYVRETAATAPTPCLRKLIPSRCSGGPRADHHCGEATCRTTAHWATICRATGQDLVGPGRHGPGNNLF
jgi:catechol 2,3-dioxygenase-like lactoylglutathione lyase family enzyme